MFYRAFESHRDFKDSAPAKFKWVMGTVTFLNGVEYTFSHVFFGDSDKALSFQPLSAVAELSWTQIIYPLRKEKEECSFWGAVSRCQKIYEAL